MSRGHSLGVVLERNPSPARLRQLLREGQTRYTELHQGDTPPSELTVWPAPNPFDGPIVEMGALVCVEYEARKDGRDWEVYRHCFDRGAMPLLGVNRGRRLLILGGGYTVTEKGIEG